MENLLYIFMIFISVYINDPGDVRVMSFNIRYGTANDGPNSWTFRKNLVFDLISDYKCDFIGLQEAFGFQADEIQQAIPGYDRIGRTREISPYEGEGCFILFDSSRWELIEQNTLWLSTTPEKPGTKSWDSALPRIFTVGKFRNRQTLAELFIYNTHFDHISEKAREESSKLILKHIVKNTPQKRVVLLGDFNALENEPPVDYLVKNQQLTLTDIYRNLHKFIRDEDATFYGWGPHTAGSGKRIDYIMATADLKAVEAEVVGFEVDGRYPSDHCPVYAKLKLGH